MGLAANPIAQPWRPDITDITAAGVFSLGDRTVNRLGYGAMQFAGFARRWRRFKWIGYVPVWG